MWRHPAIMAPPRGRRIQELSADDVSRVRTIRLYTNDYADKPH